MAASVHSPLFRAGSRSDRGLRIRTLGERHFSSSASRRERTRRHRYLYRQPCLYRCRRRGREHALFSARGIWHGGDAGQTDRRPLQFHGDGAGRRRHRSPSICSITGLATQTSDTGTVAAQAPSDVAYMMGFYKHGSVAREAFHLGAGSVDTGREELLGGMSARRLCFAAALSISRRRKGPLTRFAREVARSPRTPARSRALVFLAASRGRGGIDP